MKTIQKKLQGLIEHIEQKIEKRENYFNDRSEPWQESEKGMSYQIKTDEYEEIRDELDFILGQIEID